MRVRKGVCCRWSWMGRFYMCSRGRTLACFWKRKGEGYLYSCRVGLAQIPQPYFRRRG